MNTLQEDIGSCLPNILHIPFFYLVFDFNLKSSLAILHHRTFIVKYSNTFLIIVDIKTFGHNVIQREYNGFPSRARIWVDEQVGFILKLTNLWKNSQNVSKLNNVFNNHLKFIFYVLEIIEFVLFGNFHCIH